MTKIKNITVLTSNIDSHNDRFDIKNITFPKEVPIFKDFRLDYEHMLGKCELFKKNDKLVANLDINIDKHHILNLYPCIQFTYDKENIILNESTGVFEIKNIKMKSVGLCENGNADYSIKTIGEQINDKPHTKTKPKAKNKKE